MSGVNPKAEALHPEDPLNWAHVRFKPPAQLYSEPGEEIAAVAVLGRVMGLPLKGPMIVEPDPPDVQCLMSGEPIGIEVTAYVESDRVKMHPKQEQTGEELQKVLRGINGVILLSSCNPAISYLRAREIRTLAKKIAALVKPLPGTMRIGDSRTFLRPQLQKAGLEVFDRIVFSPQAEGGIQVATGRMHRRSSPALAALADVISDKASALPRWSISARERWLLIVGSAFASQVTIEDLREGWVPITGSGFSRIYYVDVSDLPGREEGMRLDQID